MADDENVSEHKKLDEILSLTRENNRILRKMHRGLIWGQVFTVLYWLFLLGVVGWSYYYMQPYVTKYIGTVKAMIQTIDKIQEAGTGVSGDIKGLLEKVP